MCGCPLFVYRDTLSGIPSFSFLQICRRRGCAAKNEFSNTAVNHLPNHLPNHRIDVLPCIFPDNALILDRILLV